MWEKEEVKKLKKIETDIQNHIYWQTKQLNSIPLTNHSEWNIIRIFSCCPRQTFLGMGGTFTESSCVNFSKLLKDNQDRFIDLYFSEKGLNYNFGRISIASNDFSLSPYEYLESENLSKFSITHDFKSIIPTIKKVLSQKKITFIATPWSPPKFMKSNGTLERGGTLLQQYYGLYAKYLRKFLDSYKQEGIDIQYITMQNEPYATQEWESCVYSLQEQNKFIYKYLIPNLKKSQTKVLVWDHNKDNLYDVATKLIKKNKKIAGIAYHWYTGTHATNLEYVYQKYPKALFMHTEGCCGFSKYNEKDWVKDAELLLIDLIEDLKHGMNAYIDWNLLLDFNGGPNHKQNYCKSPIILNENGNDFYLTPIYYYFGHISKYIKPGSVILPVDIYRPDLLGVGFLYNNKQGLVLLNPNGYSIEINIINGNQIINDTMLPHTIGTYLE